MLEGTQIQRDLDVQIQSVHTVAPPGRLPQARKSQLVEELVHWAALVLGLPAVLTRKGPHCSHSFPPVVVQPIQARSPGSIAPEILAHPRWTPLIDPNLSCTVTPLATARDCAVVPPT
jgi:hypothetical protein